MGSLHTHSQILWNHGEEFRALPLDEYEALKARAMFCQMYDEFVEQMLAGVSKDTIRDRLNTMALGLGGEAGEAVDIVKKVLYHGLPFTEDVQKKLRLELGDLLFYISVGVRALSIVGNEDIFLNDLMVDNMEKLQARYPGGTFSVEDFMRKEMAKADA